MKEIITKQPELKMIDTRRTSLMVIKPEQTKSITGKEYRQMLKKAWFACGVSIGVNVVLAATVYILQAGPI